ncbi:MAG: hypothetical protein RIB54_15765 [Fulvivirga sp.]
MFQVYADALNLHTCSGQSDLFGGEERLRPVSCVKKLSGVYVTVSYKRSVEFQRNKLSARTKL